MWSLTWQPYTQIKFLLLQKQIQKTGNLRILEGWQREQCLCGPQCLNLKKNNFIYLFLAVLGLRICAGLSLVAANGGYSVVVLGLLIAVASLPAEHRLCVHGLQWLQHMGSIVAAPRLQSKGSVVVAHRLSSLRRVEFSNPCPLHWQVDSYPLHHQGSPVFSYITIKPSSHLKN